jgi:predicted RNase H-like HicB family nuclease
LRYGAEHGGPESEFSLRESSVRAYASSMLLNAVIERDFETGLLVGSVPGLPGAHTQGETVEEVRQNLAEVIQLLRDEGALRLESEFIATTALMVA